MSAPVSRIGPVLSPVDYDAWNRGYRPPSEHVLIDKLQFRGARVVISTSISSSQQMWIVVEGEPLTSQQRRAMLRMAMLLDEIDRDASAGPLIWPVDAP